MVRKQKGEATWQLILGLVVLATLLALLLFPLFATGHGGSPRKACLSHVKQLAILQIMYAADYDDRFPLRDSWMDATYAYRKRSDILRCPTFVRDKEGPKNIYGYAMNLTLSGAKEPPKPETVPLIFESVNLARNASGTLDSLPNPGRHEKRSIIGYSDGHAKAVDPNKP